MINTLSFPLPYHLNAYHQPSHNKKEPSERAVNTSFIFFVCKWAFNQHRNHRKWPWRKTTPFKFTALVWSMMNITLLLVWPFCVFFFFLQSAGLRFLPFVYESLTSGCLILERVDDLDGNSCLRLHPTSTTLGFGWNTTAAAAVEVSWHFQGAVPGWDPVSIRQFSRWRLLNPHFLPSSPLLSSLCLSALKTWLGPFCKHSCLFLFSKPCIVFDYRCLKIFFLLNCCHGSVVFFFLTPTLSPPQSAVLIQ